MNRSLLILLGALALGAAIFAGSYFTAQRATVMCCTNPADDLTWLRDEFHLSAAEMTRIRALHQGYLPKCGQICAQIAAKKRELESIIGTGTNLTADLRAQCQAQMLEHFATVSQAMPPEQGQRYLAEMKRLTLGAHEQMEQSMSGDSSHEHPH